MKIRMTPLFVLSLLFSMIPGTGSAFGRGFVSNQTGNYLSVF